MFIVSLLSVVQTDKIPHIKQGAVDLDVYGAFQVCAIGVLSAPVTVKFSRTYFFNPARNLLFLWVALLCIGEYIPLQIPPTTAYSFQVENSGLLSLVIESFRIEPVPCTQDSDGYPLYFNARNFTYGTNCGLICSGDHGPFSPLRRARQTTSLSSPLRTTLPSARRFCWQRPVSFERFYHWCPCG